MIFLEWFSVEQALRYLPRSTVMMGVPTHYTRLLADPQFDRLLCRNMRLFTSGSAPLLEKTFEQFYETTGFYLLERYGMTETGVLTSNPLNATRRVGTVGLPLPNNIIRLVDDNNNSVLAGQPGHIQVQGDNVFVGYWNRSDIETELTPDGYFKTGDLGILDEEGYLKIIGRSKDMIISGGLNVYPKEIEHTINQISGVIESVVIGVPHPDFGEAVVALVVANNTLTEQEILADLRQQLANFKVPKRIVFAGELPRNAMGKVQKNVLRNLHRELFCGVAR